MPFTYTLSTVDKSSMRPRSIALTSCSRMLILALYTIINKSDNMTEFDYRSCPQSLVVRGADTEQERQHSTST